MNLHGRTSGIIALAVLLALALSASAPVPASAQAAKYKESPMLAEQVKAGKLPPVDQRLSLIHI